MKKLLLGMFLLFGMLLLLALSTQAQNSRMWRGLTLDQSTTADAVEVFGAPAKIKENQKLRAISRHFAIAPRSRMDKKTRYTSLEFTGVRGTKRVKLYFKNDSLKAILFTLKTNLEGHAFERAYDGLYFILRNGNLGFVHSYKLPYTWYHISVTQASFVIGCVKKGGIGLGVVKSRVSEIQLISTTLISTKGFDALQ